MAGKYRDFHGQAVSGFERTIRANRIEAKNREYKNLSLAEQIANLDKLDAQRIEEKRREQVVKLFTKDEVIFSGRFNQRTCTFY